MGIYAQRPDATACASMELWNETMRRWVKPGSKGIALIRKDKRGRPSLEYVFDVSDTRPVKGAKTPYLWEMREDHHAAVLNALERRYGPAGDGDIGEQIMELAARAVNEIYRDRLTDLAYDVQNSLLEELDDLNLEVRFRDVLTASVQYAVLTRCGLDPAEFMEDGDLAGITEFSTPAVLHHLGNAASAVSRELLNEIGRAVKTWDREQAKNNKKNLEKPLAFSQDIGYTEDAKEFSTVKRESKERSGEHGADLHEGGRLPDPRPDDGRTGRRGRNAPGQVRPDEGELSSRAPQRDVHVDAADRAAGSPPAGDRPAGAGAGGQDGGRSEEAERRGRSDEGTGPDGLGAGGEQLHTAGGGDRAERDRVQVNQDTEQTAGDEPAVSSSEGPAPAPFHLFPPVEEQVERIAQAQTEERQAQWQMPIPAEQVPETVIGRALTCGGNRQHSIERIVAFFQKEPTGSAAASFMEKEFGEGGKGLSISGQDYAVWFSKEGFRIAPGRTAFGSGSTLIPWVNAAAMVSNLLRDGMFASQEKIDAAEGNEYRELAEKLWHLRQDFSDSARERNLLPTVSQHFLGKGFPEDTQQLAELLKAPVSRQQIVRELAEFAGSYDRNTGLLRSRHHPDPQALLVDVVNLFTPRQEFHAAEGFLPGRASFITEDEIDRLLLGGSSYADGKFSIYSYFVQGHNAQECAKFLREAYGDGGSSYAGYDEWHDSKGIKFTRQDDESGFKGYATIRLNWNQVQKRVRALIDGGNYLSEQEREHLPDYEATTLARRIYWFYQADPNRTKVPKFDMDGAVKLIFGALRPYDPVARGRLAQEMFNILAAVRPDSEAYQRMAPVLRDVEAFRRGEYSLFKPLSEVELEAERQAKQAAKEAQKAEREAQKAEQARQIRQAQQEGQTEPEGKLAAAARALRRKMQPPVAEDDDGQISFDLFSAPAPGGSDPLAAEPAPPQAEKESSRAPWWDELNEVREAHPNSLILYQMGDFFELYGEDAKTAAALLGLTLTTRPVGGVGRVELCGFPVHALNEYVERLRENHAVTLMPVDGQTMERRVETLERTGTAQTQPQQGHEQAAEDIDRYEAQMQAGAVETTVPNYEATVTAEEAPLLARLMAGIEAAQTVQSNGDVTFHFAASEKDTVEKLIAKLRRTLSEAVASTYTAAAPKKAGRTKPELNYRTLARLFPEVVSGEYRYLRLEAGEVMMPLHLEWVGANELSVSHTYVQNGDLMRDPEMTFRVDREKGTIEPLTFQQDGSIQIYQEVYPEPNRWIPQLSRDLSTFAQQWFKNISEQGYLKKEADIERDGEDVRITFQENGTAVNPPPPKAADTSMAPAHEQAETASPSRTLDPIVLYRSLLEMVDREISRGGLGFDLREHIISYETGRNRLSDELSGYVSFITSDDPSAMAIYESLPMFREWLVEDLLERNYNGAAVDAPDGPQRHANDPDAPEWARGAPPVQKANYVLLSAKGPIQRPAAEPAEMDTAEQHDTTSTARDPMAPAYKIGDTVYLEGEPVVIRRRFDAQVELCDQSVSPPVTWMVPRNEFERQLLQDTRNSAITNFLTAHLPDVNDDLREALVGYGGLLKQKDKAAIVGYIEAGEDNFKIAQRMVDTYAGTAENIELLSGEQAAYFANRDGFEVNVHDKFGTRVSMTWNLIVPILRALYQEQLDGFLHGSPSVERSEPEQGEGNIPAPPAPEAVPEPTGAGAPEQPKNADTVPVEPDFAPHAEGYWNLKAQHPDKLVGVQVGEFMMFYGKDAEEASSALGTKAPVLDIPGLGQTPATGSREAWQAVLKKLLEHGHSVVLARPDPESGPDAPYEIIQESDAADYIPIGMELMMDGRRMKIDSVDYANNEVKLLDLDLRGWFPIFQSAPVPYVRESVEDVLTSEEYIAAEMAHQLRQEEAPEETVAASPPAHDAADDPVQLPGAEPEQVELDGGQIGQREPPAPRPAQERHNFQITDDNLGAGGEKTKYQYNVTAIRTLKQIEGEGRFATPEEQEILSRYVGWGGIAKAFDPDDPKWAKEYTELKELLTPEEYNSARSTVLNAHYTSPTVIKAVYQAVENMGFKPGTVLEPSMGIGNFFGLLPESLSGAKLYGVELDSLTGRIARQLYQNADITVDGFEKTDRRDFYDLAVGNVPFGQYHVNDPAYNRLGFNIHNYFFAKALDQVRPGGIVAFVTSRYTMDSKDTSVRKYLAERADLLGAIRLPNNTFKANAGTEVVSDIIFLQKRDRPAVEQPSWVGAGENDDGFHINNYFLEHPDMVLGTPTSDSTQYGHQDYTVAPIEGANLSEQLAGAVQNLALPDKDLLELDAADEQTGEALESIPADPSVRNFSYTLHEGKLYFRENSRMTRMELGKTPAERVKGMIAIRDSARKLIDLQLQNAKDDAVKAEQEKLNRLYDQFTKKHGLLNSLGNKMAFEQDSAYPLLCSLEVLDEDGNLERKADMFTKRTIQNRRAVTSVDTAVEALAVSIGEKARVDLEYMAGLMGGPDKIPQIVADLEGVIFKDPATGPFDMDGDREAKLKRLTESKKKDNVVTFEELGVDRLFVDEAHAFKNLFLHTKMSRVAGIAQTDAQKSSDMFGKCRYMDEITGGRGITFATGTPISNSMVELYTMMRYLQFDTLVKNGHRHFDNWAADFGEKVTAMELKPEGTGFRSKTRFAKFYNLPELMSIWKEAADIQTADMLNLPVPEAEYITVTTEPSTFQQEMVAELGERAEAVRNREVEPSVDNMLRITSDGRKLALDQRLQNPLLPDDPNSKVNACVKNIVKEWRDSTEIRGTQLVFCDLSTPKGDGKFNVYDDIKTKLIAQGIPQEEIAFIHDANTEAQKAELFAKVRRGQVRVLIGSTQKMGAGTNVQDRIVASHDLDCPWRPADLEQRAGRSLRQGNMNKKVRMYKYVTKGTFDAYNWGLVENKQKFIGQVMTSKSPARSAEDVDATALSYAEVKALATGDDRIREKMDLDVQVAKLKMLKANHTAMQYEMQDKALKYYPQQMAETKLFIEALGKDLPIVQAHPVKDDAFTMTVMGQVFTERKAAGEAIIKACMLMMDPEKVVDLGEYRGFPMQLHCNGFKFKVTMKQHLTYTAELSDDPVGNVTRINNALEGMAENLKRNETRLARLESELKNAQEEAERPFPKEEELRQKSARLTQLNRELEKPSNKGVNQHQNSDGRPNLEDGGAPARENPVSLPTQGNKPSIRDAIRAFTPPAPVSPSVEKGQRGEAAL